MPTVMQSSFDFLSFSIIYINNLKGTELSATDTELLNIWSDHGLQMINIEYKWSKCSSKDHYLKKLKEDIAYKKLISEKEDSEYLIIKSLGL